MSTASDKLVYLSSPEPTYSLQWVSNFVHEALQREGLAVFDPQRVFGPHAASPAVQAASDEVFLHASAALVIWPNGATKPWAASATVPLVIPLVILTDTALDPFDDRHGAVFQVDRRHGDGWAKSARAAVKYLVGMVKS